VRLLLLNPPWPSMILNHKIPSHLRALYTYNLGILTFHCTSTQLWNQAYNRRRLSPYQHKLTLSQKCRSSGRRSRELFMRKRMMHERPMQGNLFALLQAESEGITWKLYMWNLPALTHCPPLLTLKGRGSVPLSIAISVGTL
jgi:hypothetical protein